MRMQTALEVRQFLADTTAIGKLASLTRDELRLVLNELKQEYSNTDKKSKLLQLANAAMIDISIRNLSDGEEEEEEEERAREKGASESVGGAIGGDLSVRSRVSVSERLFSTPYKRKTIMDDMRASEKVIDDAAERIELMKMQMEENERERKREREKEEREREREREREEREREREREREEREREERERQRIHELQILQLQMNRDEKKTFDPTKALPLVPQFSETEVTEFFTGFELAANRLQWPKENWATLIHCRLTGKALKAFNTLSEDELSSFETIKAEVLKVYELVPEAYRQRFRDLHKASGQTFVDFARVKVDYFNKWLEAAGAKTTDEIKEVILLEDFKESLQKDLRLHLEDQKVKTLKLAASLADEHALTHKFAYRASSFFKGTLGLKSSSKPNVSTNKDVETSPPVTGKKTPFLCFTCQQPGHISRNCPKKKKPISLVSNIDGSTNIDPLFKSYVYDSCVSDPGESIFKRNLKALRDTGAAQSLILRSSLPDEFQIQGNRFVLLGGFPGGIVSTPLEDFHIEFRDFKGVRPFAIVERLPVTGVDCIIGNELFEGEQKIVPVLNRVPVVEKVVSAITRSKVNDEMKNLGLSDLFEDGKIERNNGILTAKKVVDKWDRKQLITEQKSDCTLKNCKLDIDTPDLGDLTKPKFHISDEILYRRVRGKYDDSVDGGYIDQIVVPAKFRDMILSEAHDNVLQGHLGITKTLSRILNNFYWPSIKKEHCDTLDKVFEAIKNAGLVINIKKCEFAKASVTHIGP